MTLPFENLVLPIALIVGGFVIGSILEGVILVRLNRVAARTTWGGDDIVVNSLRGMFVVWFGLAGVYAATLTLSLTATARTVINDVAIAILVLSLTVLSARIAGDFVKLYERNSGGALPAASIFTNLSRFLVFVIGILIVLESLGISITPILTALGVGGLAVALALQDTLANLFAGLYVLASRQIRPGDYIKLQSGEEGYVTDIAWRSTTVRVLSNNLIIIPNSKLGSTIVTNFDLPAPQMSVLVQVGVSYDSDLDKVERVTMEVGKQVMLEVTGGVPESDPFIRYHTFADFSINFTVILQGRTYVDQYLLTHEFIKRLHTRYRAEGIVIPFPVRTIEMKGTPGQTE
jgi:small-conductance mechanosensitive channel